MSRTALFFCATPRSGSHFAADLIWSTRVLGCPREFACEADITQWRDYLGCASYGLYKKKFVDLHSTDNEVLSIFIMNFQIRRAEDQNCAEKDLLFGLLKGDRKNFTKFLYLTRRDRLSQAVSWAVARKLDYWHYLDVPKQDEVTVSELLNAWDFIENEYKSWAMTFDKFDINPIEFVYEDWTADTENFLLKISELVSQKCYISGMKRSNREKNTYKETVLLKSKLEQALKNRNPK